MAASSISRRIESSVDALAKKDYESAFIHLFPAIDKTAKKRRPSDGVGKRIKAFISDEEAIITAIATNNIIQNINIDGIDFPTALYKFGRTSIAHEGELDERLQINEAGSIQIGQVWNLPSSYITGLIVSVIGSPENLGEHVADSLVVTLFGEAFKVNDIWGEKGRIQNKICEVFKNDDLFK
jgi:hypothetical protein